MLRMLLVNLRRLLRLVNLPETPRNCGYSSAIAKEEPRIREYWIDPRYVIEEKEKATYFLE
jgi:hypothetical protein